MINLIKNKIQKRKRKRTFEEYGFIKKQFDLEQDGAIEYAQWTHPSEGPKVIDQAYVDFFREFLQEGDLGIDIGAHTGDTSVPMAVAAGKSGTVLALEPNRYVFAILKENAKLNTNKTNIIPLNFAAVHQDGHYVFNYSDASFCNGGFLSEIKTNRHHHNYELEVEGKNLEQYLHENYASLLPKLTLVKIDAEGYDKEVMKSMESLLTAYRPYIISECYKRLTREERTELFQVATELNYHLYHLEGFTTDERIEIQHERDMMKWKHFDFVMVPKNKGI